MTDDYAALGALQHWADRSWLWGGLGMTWDTIAVVVVTLATVSATAGLLIFTLIRGIVDAWFKDLS